MKDLCGFLRRPDFCLVTLNLTLTLTPCLSGGKFGRDDSEGQLRRGRRDEGLTLGPIRPLLPELEKYCTTATRVHVLLLDYALLFQRFEIFYIPI